MSGRLGRERELEILRAALHQVAEKGYDATTVDDIARAARCSKATLYRRYEDKLELIVAALDAVEVRPATLPDTGSFRGDLIAISAIGHASYAGQASVLTALLHASANHPRLGEALRACILDRSMTDLDVLTRRAVARGELSKDSPVLKHLHTLLLAPLALGTLTLGREPELAEFRIWIEEVILPLIEGR
ncbi:MAG: TetR/AcrR family transcriptional regulator [Alphaproteobacteria bacterium]|nr:TetR/AcrR family transcriptional regulator [Alphaproteobacteria bacterium]